MSFKQKWKKELLSSQRHFFRKYIKNIKNRKFLPGYQKTVNDFESEKVFRLKKEIKSLKKIKKYSSEIYELYVEIESFCEIMTDETFAQIFLENLIEEESDTLYYSKKLYIEKYEKKEKKRKERKKRKNKGK